MLAPPNTFDVFISYSRRDRAFTAALESALQQYRPPRAIRAGRERLKVFRDEDDFTGSEYHDSLQENLQASSKLVVICSPAARHSSYVDDEVRRFAAERQPRDIIPVLLSGIPNNEVAPGQDAERAFPESLLSVLALPLAVDYRGFDTRAHKLSRRPYDGAWFTLLANICDTSRAEIEQRERHRERGRRVRIAAIVGAVAVSAVFGVTKARSAALERSRALAQLATDAVDRGAFDQALRFAVLAMQGNWVVAPAPEAEAALRRAAHASHHIATLEGQGTLSPDGHVMASRPQDGTIRVSSIDSGEVVAAIKETEQPKSIVFSPDGRLLATQLDHVAHVWQITTGQRVTELVTPEPVQGLTAFDATGRMLLTKTEAAAQLWDISSGKLIATMPREEIEEVGVSPDGRTVFVTASDGTVQLFDTNGVSQKRIAASTNRFLRGVFSPDSKILLTFSTSDRNARLWSVDTGAEIRELSFDDETLSFAAFSPDGALVVTAALYKNRARVWDVATGTRVADVDGPAQFSSLTLSPDGEYVLAGFADGTAALWVARTGRRLTTFTGHKYGWLTARFSRDGDRAITSGADGKTRLWSVRSGNVPRLLDGHTSGVRSALFSPDGKRVVTSSWDKTARIWDVETGRELKRLVGHTSTIALASFDTEAERVVTVSHDGTARIWSAGTGNQLTTLIGHEVMDEGEMRTGSFSPDGSLVVTASDDRTARLWTSDGKAIATLNGHTNAVWFAAFSPDGHLVVTASDDGTARLWRTPEGTLVATMAGHTSFVRTAALSADGKLLVTASDDKTARVWEVPSGRPLHTLSLHTGRIAQVLFSPDRSRIVTASDDGTARIWTARGEPIARVDPHGGGVVSVAFSANGRLLATGSFDKVAHLWDVAGAELARFDGHETYVGAVAFSPDGTLLLTSGGNTPRLYDLYWLSRPGGTALVTAVCREKLRGIGRITEDDGVALRDLRGRVGEEVCGTAITGQ